MSKESVLGTLVIVVLKAQHLIDNHTFYKQDPYARLSLSGAAKQTPVDPKGGQHPVWDAELRFPISKDPSKSNRTLTISVFSEERKDDSLLGEATIDITDTLKTGEFDNWVPLSLKDTQRGQVYLEMTFFAAGPAPLTRRPSKFTSPSDRIARPQQPIAQQRVASQPSSSLLSPPGQASWPRPQDGPRQGRPRAQQVPLPGSWPGKSAQQQQPPQHAVPSHARRDEDAPLPPLPVDVIPKEEFVPSTLRPGGPSRTVAQPTHDTRYVLLDPPAQERYPAIANGATRGAAGHHHVTNPQHAANASSSPTHSYTLHQNQNTPPFPGSPAPQAHILSSSPQPQGEPQPHARRVSLHSTQGASGHVGYPLGGHGNTQPSPQTQPEFPHAQYHSPSQQPPQQQHHVQYSPWQQTQPPAGQPPPHISSYPPNSHSPAQPYGATQSLGSTPPGQSHVATPSPPPSVHSYVTTQSPSPPAQSRIATPSPVAMVSPTHSYAATTSNPVSPSPSHVATTSPPLFVPPPPPQHYVPGSSPVPPTQPQLYAATPVPSTQSYAASTSPAPHAQQYIPPTLVPPAPPSAPSPPAQLHTPSTHTIFPLPTSPPPMPPYGSSLNPPLAPSFPAPSFPVPQATTDYFGTVTATAFSPQDEPNLPDPYLLRRYQTPLPLPPGVSRPPGSGSTAKQKPSAPAVSNRRRDGAEDEVAARELQRREEESARTRREQEERDAELARTLDLELNLDRGGGRAQEGPRGPSHLPPRHVGMVNGNIPGGW